MEGKKYDTGKTRYSLLPPHALEDVAEVLTHGAETYGAENWRFVEHGGRRYTDALFRHIESWRRGEARDSESGLPHLAHAACCLLFLLELEDPTL